MTEFTRKPLTSTGETDMQTMSAELTQAVAVDFADSIILPLTKPEETMLNMIIESSEADPKITGYKLITKNASYAMITLFTETFALIPICPVPDEQSFMAFKDAEIKTSEQQLELFGPSLGDSQYP